MASVRQSMWFSFLTESWPKAITRRGSALPWASSAFFYKVPCAFWPWFDLCEGQTWPELCHTEVGKMSLLAYWVVVLWMLGVNLVSQDSNILLPLPKEEVLYFLRNFSLHGKKTNTKGSVQKTVSENICCCMHSLTSTGPSIVPASCEAGVGGTSSLTAGCLGSVQQTGL